MSVKSGLEAPVSIISDLESEVVFRPSEEQRAIKSAFLARIADNPTIDINTVEMTTIKRVLNKGNSFDKHWSQPGFREWFRNSTEYAEKLEGLFDLALDAAGDILRSTEPKVQGARVQMIKAIAELANKYPKKQSVTNPLLSAVEGMDKAQLSAYLEKNGVTIQLTATQDNADRTVNVTPAPADKSGL